MIFTLQKLHVSSLKIVIRIMLIMTECFSEEMLSIFAHLKSSFGFFLKLKTSITSLFNVCK